MNDAPLQSQIVNRKSQIVIPMVAGIGNALLAEPMLRQMTRDLPDARVTVQAISKPIAQAIERVPGVSVTVTGKGIKNMLRAAAASRRLKPDVFLVPFPSNRWQYNVLASASGAKRVVMHGYPVGQLSALNFLHRNRLPADRSLHDVKQNLSLLKELGLRPDFTMTPRFPVSDDDRAAAKTVLNAAGVGDRDFVVIHAGSAQTVLAEAKRWPAANYAKLVEAIRDETGKAVLIVEGPDEAGVSADIAGRLTDRRDVFTAVLRGTLGGAAAVMEKAAFYAGTDSGLAHLAGAVGRRPITLFAPADPDRVCPHTHRDLVVQPPGLKRPSFLYPYESTSPKMRPPDATIHDITVDHVLEKVRKVMAEIPT